MKKEDEGCIKEKAKKKKVSVRQQHGTVMNVTRRAKQTKFGEELAENLIAN
jgi:hypothetical protein